MSDKKDNKGQKNGQHARKDSSPKSFKAVLPTKTPDKKPPQK